MKAFVNTLISRLASSMPGVGIYRLAALLGEVRLRLGSVAKQAALFPTAERLALDRRTDLKYPQNIRFGSDVIVGAQCQIGAMAPVIIGDWVRLSRGVVIETATLDLSGPLPYRHVAHPIVIGRGVWLGAGAMVLGGVTIGDGAVVGAGAVVSKDVPAGAVIVGAACRQLRPAKFEER